MKNEEITLYPVWNVECTYIYNPEEGKEYERNMTGVSYVNELNYHTMIVNAQTGEFMNPVELKEIFAVLCALLLVPTIPAVCCAESYQEHKTLREQSPKEVVY